MKADSRRRRRPVWYGIVTTRRGGPLPPHRAASRLSAYVYGNILVLASVAVANGHTIDEGTAALLVVGTGITTYIAHVFADVIAHATIPEGHGQSADTDPGEFRESVLDELRDAVPIVSSASWPAIILALGWLDAVPTQVAQLVAGGIVVIRIASIEIVSERVRGNRLTFRVLVAGLVTAALAAVIVVAKTYVGH